LIIIHAGNAQESSGQRDDIWSFKHKIVFGSNNYYETASGYKFVDYIMVAETSPLGTSCHEFGHVLGLPDIYNTYTGTSTCGEWDLMDSGGWTDDGNTPSHISAWCKKYLGWGNVTTIDNEPTSLKITPTETLDSNTNNNEFYKINILGDTNEYFLLEYRNQTGFDEYLPGKGMLIWHIDEELATSRIDSNRLNIGYPHDAVKLIPADGTSSGTQSTDLFKDEDSFGYPSNKSFSGVDSNITLSNFIVNTDYMNFSTYVLKISETTSISNFLNYPNPIYNSLTTFKLEITKPLATSTNCRIYDISGKLVYEKSIGQSELDLSNSTDYNFIYKFDWNCKDLNNNEVASGVYIYFINLGNTKKAGKLAILR